MLSTSARVPRLRPVVSATLLATLLACGVPTWRPTLIEPEAVPPGPSVTGQAAHLKVHTQSGELYVLSSWSVPGPTEPLHGSGTLYGLDRTVTESGQFDIPRGDIALLETNRQELVSRFAFSGLAVYSALWGLVTVTCLADPKSCFGSCPTFYGDDGDRPLAEGFSSSFARALEDDDIDALGLRRPPGPTSILMRNEAQETHAIRGARLVGVDPRGARHVLQGGYGGFFGASVVDEPTSCMAAGMDCRAAVAAFDDEEYSPRTDPDDLGRREEVLLTFDGTPGQKGIVLAARQSLVTTYVFYQALAYAGDEAGALLASLERSEPGARERVLGVADALGGIEVSVRRGSEDWASVGEFTEAGPIATDRLVFPVPGDASGPIEVRLRMAQGSWRVDWVGLAQISRELQPTVLPLDSVTVDGVHHDVAHQRLTDPGIHLVTAPGDAYRLWYTVPAGGSMELFLDTEGFYYEWMRSDWLSDQNEEMSAVFLLDPERALRELAPLFKKREETMDRLFWASRFRR